MAKNEEKRQKIPQNWVFWRWIYFKLWAITRCMWWNTFKLSQLKMISHYLALKQLKNPSTHHSSPFVLILSIFFEKMQEMNLSKDFSNSHHFLNSSWKNRTKNKRQGLNSVEELKYNFKITKKTIRFSYQVRNSRVTLKNRLDYANPEKNRKNVKKKSHDQNKAQNKKAKTYRVAQ